ncbi:MAG: hypothetical protein V2I51_22810, partial [Anderseniella sp.]|nr:hypothetical protein [Anderseniella sp.]
MHIIVHIGPPKTGTSSIQAALRINRDYLASQDIYVYQAQKMTSKALALAFMGETRNSMPDIRQHFPAAADAVAWSEACWEEFEAEVSARKPAVSVISSEMFGNLRDPSAFVARLGRTFERITVVGYVRDPVELYVSQLAQHIRSGARFRDLKSPLEYKYPKIWRIDNYIELLGLANIRVRNFSRSNLRGGDVVVDFFQTVAYLAKRKIALPTMPERVNESLPAAATVWLMTL